MKQIIFAILLLCALSFAMFANFSQTYSVDYEACINCELCVDVCPNGAIEMKNGKAVIDISKCNNCGECTYICPTDAIVLIDKKMARPYIPPKIETKQEMTKTDSIAEPTTIQKIEASTKEEVVAEENIKTDPKTQKKFIEKVKEVITDITYFVDASKCISCEICVRKCPVNAIEMVNGKAVIDTEKCIDCDICEQVCPTEAIYHESTIEKQIIREEIQSTPQKQKHKKNEKPALKVEKLVRQNNKVEPKKEQPVQKTVENVADNNQSPSPKSPQSKIKKMIEKVIYFVEASKCIGCDICVRKCPVDAIEMVNNKAVIDMDKCIECGICENICPTKAISHKTETEQSTATPKPSTAEKIEPEEKKVADEIAKTTIESIKEKLQYLINRFACVGCEDCVQDCPVNAIEIFNGKAVIDQTKCIDCGICVESCTYGAIEENNEE